MGPVSHTTCAAVRLALDEGREVLWNRSVVIAPTATKLDMGTENRTKNFRSLCLVKRPLCDPQRPERRVFRAAWTPTAAIWPHPQGVGCLVQYGQPENNTPARVWPWVGLQLVYK